MCEIVPDATFSFNSLTIVRYVLTAAFWSLRLFAPLIPMYFKPPSKCDA